MPSGAQTKNQRTFSGSVVSTAMNKTIVVRIDTMNMHSKYQKRYRSSKKYHVHDEKGTAKAGDTVQFVECRPISKTKRWRLVSVLNT
jgi:small subunit ribosomal protein S17